MLVAPLPLASLYLQPAAVAVTFVIVASLLGVLEPILTTCVLWQALLIIGVSVAAAVIIILAYVFFRLGRGIFHK